MERWRPLSRPERTRRLPKPLGSGSRRLPSVLGWSAGPAGQGSAPQRPLPVALGERRPSPKSGGRGGAGARERGAARRGPGKAGRGPALRAAVRPSPLFPPPPGAAPPSSPRAGSGGGGAPSAPGGPRPGPAVCQRGLPAPSSWESRPGRGRSGPGARQPSARSAPRGAPGAGSRRSCPLAAFGAPRSDSARAGSAPHCRRAAASCGNEPELREEGRNRRSWGT